MFDFYSATIDMHVLTDLQFLQFDIQSGEHSLWFSATEATPTSLHQVSFLASAQEGHLVQLTVPPQVSFSSLRCITLTTDNLSASLISAAVSNDASQLLMDMPLFSSRFTILPLTQYLTII